MPIRNPLLAVAADEDDPTGKHRRREQGRGEVPAGSSTLCRLELAPADADAEVRYKEMVAARQTFLD